MRDQWKKGVTALLLLVTTMFVQGQVSWTDRLSSEDSAAVAALVLYPDDLRLSIFEACAYPELIVRISVLQGSSNAEFTEALAPYSREAQEDIWNLTRYQGLIAAMAAIPAGDGLALERLAQQYPEDIRIDIVNYGTTSAGLIRKINDLDNKAAAQYNTLLKGYPTAAQDAFNRLIGYPEVMQLLHDHLEMAVLVGDQYRKDPAGLLRTADSLNLVTAQQQAENLAAWQKTLKEDPQAMAELRTAGTEYAQANGYSEAEYTTAPAEYYLESYTCYPYPYWYGYPYWYPYYYWYPYPWWWDWGFYIDPWGNVIIFSMPSYYFTYWYFYYPDHWYHHPHLMVVYVEHYYYGPHRAADANAQIVGAWMQTHRDYLPASFDKDPGTRANTIRDLAKLEKGYQEWMAANPASGKTKAAYFAEHEKEFTHLAQPDQRTDGIRQPVDNAVLDQPPVKQPSVKPSPEPARSPEKPKLPQYDFNRVIKAQEHHRSTWEPSRQQTPKKPVNKTRSGGQ